MSLEKLKINNFQIHEDVELELSKTITTIIGDSDRGKSAILRALIWNLTNKPKGDDFINWNADNCSVELNIDGHSIVRSRGKKENKYTLDGSEFKALGNDIPDEILNLTNVSEKNIQQQHDGIFWFTLSPSQVAEQLNSIVDMEIVDHTFSQLNSKIRTNKSETNVYLQLCDETEGKLLNLENIESLEEIVREVDKKRLEIERKSLSRTDIEKILTELGSNSREIKEIRNFNKIAKRVVFSFNELQKKSEEQCELSTLVEKIKSNNKELNKKQTITIKDLKRLEKLNNCYLLTKEKVFSLEKCVAELARAKNSLAKTSPITLSDILILEKTIKTLDKCKNSNNSLSVLLKKAKQNKAKIADSPKVSNKDLACIEKKNKMIDVVSGEIDELKTLILNVVSGKEKINAKTKVVVDKKKELEKELAGECPLCGRK